MQMQKKVFNEGRRAVQAQAGETNDCDEVPNTHREFVIYLTP